jgi:RNA polymerase sigma factor (sigma-70 family)
MPVPSSGLRRFSWADGYDGFLRAGENGVFYNWAMAWDGVHALVSQAKAGDARAWEQLVELARPHLLSVVLCLFDPAAPWQSVSDLLQETWMRAWQGLADFRGGSNDDETGALFRSWLTRTLKRTCSNGQRYANAGRREPPGLRSLNGRDTEAGPPEPAADEPEPSTMVRSSEARRQVAEALARLSDATDREIIRLYRWPGCSCRPAARRPGTLDCTAWSSSARRTTAGNGRSIARHRWSRPEWTEPPAENGLPCR